MEDTKNPPESEIISPPESPSDPLASAQKRLEKQTDLDRAVMRELGKKLASVEAQVDRVLNDILALSQTVSGAQEIANKAIAMAKDLHDRLQKARGEK